MKFVEINGRMLSITNLDKNESLTTKGITQFGGMSKARNYL